MTRENGTQRFGFSPLAGVPAGSMAVVFAFGVLCLAWHRVAGHVSLAVMVLAYAVIVSLAVVTAAGTWLVVLWVAHRHRNPELLVRRVQVAAAEPVPQAIGSAGLPAIGPPRVYFTDAQFAALMRRQEVAFTQLPGDDHDQRPA